MSIETIVLHLTVTRNNLEMFMQKWHRFPIMCWAAVELNIYKIVKLCEGSQTFKKYCDHKMTKREFRR